MKHDQMGVDDFEYLMKMKMKNREGIYRETVIR